MSKNYTKYSKHVVEKPVLEQAVEETVETPEVEETVETPEVEEEIIPVEPTITKGTVVNCKKLNVRIEPKRNAGIASIIDGGSEVEIDLKESTPMWYAVTTESGIEGYCVKEFISVI